MGGPASPFPANSQSSLPAAWRRWPVFFACALAGWMAGSSRAADSPPGDSVTTFGQFYNLSSDQAAKGLPLRLKGVVLCSDFGWGQLYIHDGRDTGYLNPQSFRTEPEAGQSVEITGTTTWQGNQLGLTNLNLVVLGPGSLPPPKRLALPQLGGDLGQWIETTGRVRVAEASSGRLEMLLHDRGQSCQVYVMGLPGTNDYRRLLDSLVRVRGINGSKVVDGRLASASIMVPALQQITVLAPAVEDPLRIPVLAIGSLLGRELGSWTNSRVHVSGLVATHLPGQSLVVQDSTGLLRARIVQATRTQPGDRVDLWGYLRVSPDETVLDEAYFEVAQSPVRAATGASVQPVAPPATNFSAAPMRLADVRRLPQKRLDRGVPVRVRGVVTYADAAWRSCFLQDESDAIYVDLGQPDIHSGQWVEVTGQARPGRFAPCIADATIRVLGATNLPAPIRVDLNDLANGQWDARWVAIAGVVRSVTAEWGHLYLNLATPAGRFQAFLPWRDDQPPPPDLIDARVRVQGACISELNLRGQVNGITLEVPGLEQVRILSPAPSDPFGVAATPIAAVATFDPKHRADRRVKVSGVVTLKIPDQGFFLQDASGGLRVLTQQTNELHLGDRVEAVGFPALGDFAPFLEEALFRAAGSGVPPTPKPTTAERVLLDGTNDGQVVTLEARLLRSVLRSAAPELAVQAGPVVFTARFGSAVASRALFALQPGSLLRLTGVCAVRGGERHEPEAFWLLLRQPADVALLEAPSWWTTRHALGVAGGLSGALLWTLASAGILRHQVRRRTRDLQHENAERQRAELALRESQALYHSLVEHLPQNIFRKDREGRFTFANRRFCEALGKPWEEIAGRTDADFFPPSLAEKYRADDRHVLETGGTIEVEEAHQRPNGQKLYVQALKTPLRDSRGQTIGVQGAFWDITERKEAEARLRETLDFNQKLVRSSPLGILAYQAGGPCVMANAAATEAIGASVEQALLQNYRDIPSWKASGLLAAAEQTLATGQAHRLEVHLLTSFGRELWLECSLTCFESGGVPHLLLMFSDITERKQLEDGLRKLSRAVEQSPASVVITDPQGNIDYVNPKFARATGYTLEEVRGKNPRVLKSGATPPEVYAEMWRAIMAGREWCGEFHNRRKDGSLFWEAAVISGIPDEAGRLTHFLAVKEDITERKRTEEEIQRLNAELEQRVLHRTAQLQVANKELEAFSYSVSHDLRAPLRAIDGYTRILVEDHASRLDAEGRRLLDVVCREARRMGQLIDDLLEFSRLGRREMTQGEFDMAAQARTVFEELRIRQPERPVQAHFQPLLPIRGDQALMRQVWVNLLSNALKYTQGRAPAVIEVGSRSQNGVIIYHVKDNGAGFDMRYVAKLFGVFQRLHRAEEFDGTGVGLALVQRIIHRHGGRVWAEGEVGKGATFYFALPNQTRTT